MVPVRHRLKLTLAEDQLISLEHQAHRRPQNRPRRRPGRPSYRRRGTIVQLARERCSKNIHDTHVVTIADFPWSSPTYSFVARRAFVATVTASQDTLGDQESVAR